MEKLGKILKEKRLEKNLSLREVSDRTKIRVNILEGIESGNCTDLPPIYMKAFVRTYCDFLDIDKSIIPEDYKPKPPGGTAETPEKSRKKIGLFFDGNDDTDSGAGESKFDLESSNERPNPLGNIIIYTSIVLIVLAGLYFGVFRNILDIRKEKEVVAFDQVPPTDTTVIGNSENTLFRNIKPPEPDSIKLMCKATGEAWMRIIIDGKRAEEVYMRPGMQKTWVAKDFFELTQGNVGAVEYYRNGQLLEPFGAKGSVVRNIVITKSALDNVTKSEQDSIKRAYFKKKKPKKKEKKEPILIEPVNFDESFIKKDKKKEKKEKKNAFSN